MIIKALIQQFFHCLMGMFSGHQAINSQATTSILCIPVWIKYKKIECACGKVFYEPFSFEKRFGNSPIFIPFWQYQKKDTRKKKNYKRKRPVRINPAIPKSMLNKARKAFKSINKQ